MAGQRFRVLRALAGLLGLAGAIPLLAGLVRSISQNQWGVSALLPVIIGGAFVLIALAANFPAILQGISAKKALIGTNVIIMILAATAILGFASYLNARHYKRFDITQLRRYSLSEKSRNILKGLKEPIRITTLFTQYEPPVLYGEIMDLLEEYKYGSGKIELEHIDAYYETDKVQQIASRLNTDLSALRLNSVIFESGDRRKDVLYDDMVVQEPPEYPYGYQRAPPKLNAESAFTTALITVSEPVQTQIYFLTGQGERDIQEYERPGLSDLAKELRRENFKIENLNLLQQKQVPEDCELLVVPAPGTPLADEILDALRTYLNSNGSLLVMLEPLTARTRNSRLRELLYDYGVKIRNDLQVGNYMGAVPLLGRLFSYELIIDSYAPHKVTEGLRTRASFLAGACLVDAEPASQPQGHRVSVLFRSTPGGWAEANYTDRNIRFDTDVDIRGPISLAVAVEPKPEDAGMPLSSTIEGAQPDQSKPKGPKLVVFGDVDFISNALIYKGSGNVPLFLNAVNWLTGKETHLGIGPKEPEHRFANLTPRNLKMIYWIVVAGLPGLCIFMGALVWTVRRL